MAEAVAVFPMARAQRTVMEFAVERCAENVRNLADDARHLVRSVASAFDAYLGAAGPIYSRAV